MYTVTRDMELKKTVRVGLILFRRQYCTYLFAPIFFTNIYFAKNIGVYA